jgi:membrane-bound lytic murein transglycosylase D
MTTAKNTLIQLSSAALFFLFFAGCAHQPSRTGAGPDGTQLQDTDPEAPQVTLREVESFRLSDPEGPKVVAEELEQIPTEMNPLVQKWLDYFQGRGRPHMERYLARSTRYMKLMKKILRQNGLPEDLVYIALIESGFSHKATSHAAAVGYWQFIRGTGKRYGLEINSLVDERRDPVLATQAAAEYFKGLYSVFGSWYLAMASYNVGENRVKREVMNHYTRDFWDLARKRRFPAETINYIPKFIAAKLIGNNPASYGFNEIDYMTPIEFEHIKVDRPVNLAQMAQKMGIDYEDFKMLNPKFRGEIAPLKKNGLELRVPVGQTEAALVAARESFVDRVSYVADTGDTQIHRVRSGDSLHTIAKKYRTTVAWLRDANDLKKGRKLRIGQRLAVPDRSGRKATVVKAVAKADPREATREKEDVEKASAAPELVTQKGVFYIVQPGDTLSAIADDYSSTIEEIRRMNKLSRGSILKAGMKLRVPKDEGLPVDPSGTPVSERTVADKEEPQSGAAPTEAKAPPASGERAESAIRRPQSVSDKSEHVVRAGENLTTIARKYGVSIQAIRKANKMNRRATLRVGARLVIPEDRPQNSKTNPTKSLMSQASEKRGIARRPQKQSPRIHVVRAGENLTRIAEKYQVPLSTLREENQIKSSSKLFVGSRLLIPESHASVDRSRARD